MLAMFNYTISRTRNSADSISNSIWYFACVQTNRTTSLHARNLLQSISAGPFRGILFVLQFPLLISEAIWVEHILLAAVLFN